METKKAILNSKLLALKQSASKLMSCIIIAMLSNDVLRKYFFSNLTDGQLNN